MENLENEKEEVTKEIEVYETDKNEETEMSLIQDFGAMRKRTDTKTAIYTNIKDAKKIFNLENKIDNLINDCEGELIRVKEVLIKIFEKPMKEPTINEETGEIEKDKEVTMACILIDDNNKSYATGSKIFTIQMMRYIESFGISDNGFEIKILKIKNENGNKTLRFEVV